MLDLFLALTATTAQIQIVAQATTVYLPISTTQSSRQNCVTYTATNATSQTVRNVYVNRRDSRGEVNKYYLISSLKSGEDTSFDICDNSFVNVEAKQ
jgi:hypothetical protein